MFEEDDGAERMARKDHWDADTGQLEQGWK